MTVHSLGGQVCTDGFGGLADVDLKLIRPRLETWRGVGRGSFCASLTEEVPVHPRVRLGLPADCGEVYGQ